MQGHVKGRFIGKNPNNGSEEKNSKFDILKLGRSGVRL